MSYELKRLIKGILESDVRKLRASIEYLEKSYERTPNKLVKEVLDQLKKHLSTLETDNDNS